ncbi:ABC transporter ATP-binding protein [Turicibacter sanguinis]|uniref:ATP-binding cassette domain-containing protein n=2 Tax=Turicibacter sanguinis TaxID=154288 RepID=A0A9X4XFY6_9FIRM|nr:ABC transporter ATP-binding protein [Turicibacter sanguinis]EFF62505.1 ABC transporter, ATP-binding protein [Turicibacter sanguinis PC909]MCU7192701.1 ABC transporter ATP-binding protein [Turicibacter sanguinis]MDB8545538.1 ABC transporter ATP-binding protein [Turicibacter sanguinis]MDB8556669.1 ABC transporter ATP-binding protein [Turicibacter sanguinis]MDB8559433.1 ABC transporter ATP-binding protein [Turicibacter sanguinis]
MSERRRVLSIRDLEISFGTTAGKVSAIRGVRLDLYQGETLAIVGESGSGKSVTTKAILGILSENGQVEKGSILFSYDRDGEVVTRDLTQLTSKQMQKHIRGKRIAMVFQDPMTSLDPTMTIGHQIIEGMREHYKISKDEARKKAIELLELVGITDPEKRYKQYPHQLSGGMRQRVVIAIALACEPELLICDEPTTALDVTIQAKILKLLKEIQEKTNVAIIFITHDLGVVANIADYVAVMYAGKIIEKGSVEEIFYDPRHPYTWGLLSSIPDLESDDEYLYTIPGSPPNLLNQVEGDAFAPRNAVALNIDYRLEPPMYNVGGKHRVASWLMDERAPHVEMPEALKRRIEKMKRGGQ